MKSRAWGNDQTNAHAQCCNVILGVAYVEMPVSRRKHAARLDIMIRWHRRSN